MVGHRPCNALALFASDMGYTTGPVATPDGKLIASFHSTWRREVDGRWRVVFDNGQPACTCPK